MKTCIIAEIGTSHGGDIDKAKRLVEKAASCGADCVKTQIVFADEILHPDSGLVPLPSGNVPLYEVFKSLEKSEDFFFKMRDFCSNAKVKFCATPFGAKSFALMERLEPCFVKIASPELNHFALLKLAAKTRLDVPVALSAGVSRLSDIEKALDILWGKKIVLMHCVVCYPAREESYNLRLLQSLGAVFGVDVGVSDHSLDPVLVPAISVALGAKIVEKHFCLSKDDGGLDDKVALPPGEFSKMCAKIRECEKLSQKDALDSLKDEFGGRVESILGDGVKTLAPDEAANYGRTNRSLHYLRDMKAGEKVSFQNVAALRTEKVLSQGISPEFFSEIDGAILTCNVKNGEGAQWRHFIQR